MTHEHPWEDFRADRARFGPHAWLLQPSLYVVAVYRFGRWTLTAPRVVRPFAHGVYFAMYSIIRLITGVDIPRTAQFGGGLMIHHFGGVIVNPRVVAGVNCTLRNGVTIGVRSDLDNGVPTVGDDVDFGTHAVAIGPIRIGDRVTIGAGAVVTKSFEAGVTVVGVPAQAVESKSKT